MKQWQIIDVKTKQVQATIAAPGGTVAEPNVTLFTQAGKACATVRLQPGYQAVEVVEAADAVKPGPLPGTQPVLRRVQPERVDPFETTKASSKENGGNPPE